MTGTAAVAGRVLLSLRGDRRTLGLVFGAPILLIWLFSEVFAQVPAQGFDLGPAKAAMMAIFVFFLTFLLTAVGFLRERQTDTIERVFASPASRWGIVLGYVVGFGALAIVQAAVLLGAGVWFLDLSFEHGVALFFALELLGALTALGIGIVVSLFARNEFQVVQFIPIVITPQVILGGVFIPVEALPIYLEVFAWTFPLTYLLEGMAYAILGVGGVGDLLGAIGALVGFSIVSIAASALAMGRAKAGR